MPTISRFHAFASLSLFCLSLSACGGSTSSGSTASTAQAAATAATTSTPTTTAAVTGVVNTFASSTATAANSTTAVANTTTAAATTPTTTTTKSATTGTATAATTTAATTSAATTTSNAGTGPAARLAAKLGKPGQLLIGLGGQGDAANPDASIAGQSIHIDIYERYLGTGDWTSWNHSPDYVGVVIANANALGAIPMFTQYQMANDGENNMGALQDASFMSTYWARVIVLFKDLGAYGKPALVNLEPDFWGFTEHAAKNGDPTTVPALVSAGSVANPDCAAQPDNVKGLAQCLLVLARKYAPKAYVGFPPSSWGATSEAAVVAWMNALGAQNADFVVEQTLDRDSGCYEVNPQPSWCSRTGSGWYWDESNLTHPNFADALANALIDHVGIGNLPLLWWQTPEGVPSSTPGGSAHHYRDDRVHYFLTHPALLTAAGGLGVVFGDGENHQTNITTDGGQMARLSAAYEAAPAMLP